MENCCFAIPWRSRLLETARGPILFHSSGNLFFWGLLRDEPGLSPVEKRSRLGFRAGEWISIVLCPLVSCVLKGPPISFFNLWFIDGRSEQQRQAFSKSRGQKTVERRKKQALLKKVVSKEALLKKL